MDDEKTFYSKLSDEEKEEFIQDVLQCLAYDNTLNYLNEYYDLIGNRFLENEAFDKMAFIVRTIKDRIAKKKKISHFWVSYKD